MPLKYVWGIKEPNYVVGMAHGVLFLAYCIWVLVNHYDRKWKLSRTGILLVASLVPFMTFWAEKRYLRD
jgi:integral membrane protein